MHGEFRLVRKMIGTGQLRSSEKQQASGGFLVLWKCRLQSSCWWRMIVTLWFAIRTCGRCLLLNTNASLYRLSPRERKEGGGLLGAQMRQVGTDRGVPAPKRPRASHCYDKRKRGRRAKRCTNDKSGFSSSGLALGDGVGGAIAGSHAIWGIVAQKTRSRHDRSPGAPGEGCMCVPSEPSVANVRGCLR